MQRARRDVAVVVDAVRVRDDAEAREVEARVAALERIERPRHEPDPFTERALALRELETVAEAARAVCGFDGEQVRVKHEPARFYPDEAEGEAEEERAVVCPDEHAADFRRRAKHHARHHIQVRASPHLALQVFDRAHLLDRRDVADANPELAIVRHASQSLLTDHSVIFEKPSPPRRATRRATGVQPSGARRPPRFNSLKAG